MSGGLRSPHHVSYLFTTGDDEDPRVERVRVVDRAPHTEWPEWLVERWDCGHGTVRANGNVSERRDCRLCGAGLRKEQAHG